MYERGQKEEHIDTIEYEINMLDFSFQKCLDTKHARERGEWNAFLECFLLHYRNLIEFFSDKDVRKDGSDLRITAPLRWAPPGADVSLAAAILRRDLYEKYWTDLSRYLEHVTTFRADDIHRPWWMVSMYEEISATLNTFEKAFMRRREVPGGVHVVSTSPEVSGSTETVLRHNLF